MSFFILLNTKDDILKNVGNQTVDDCHWLPYFPEYVVLVLLMFQIGRFCDLFFILIDFEQFCYML